MSENCKSLVLQDKCNIEIFLSPVTPVMFLVDILNSQFRLINGNKFMLPKGEAYNQASK